MIARNVLRGADSARVNYGRGINAPPTTADVAAPLPQILRHFSEPPPPGNRNARSAFDSLAAIGYRDEARELFVNIVTRRNSFGLLTQDMPGGMPSGMKVSTRER